MNLDFLIKVSLSLKLLNKNNKMKFLKFLFVLSLLTVVACNSAPERPAPLLDPNYVSPAATSASTVPIKAPEPAQNSLGVWHYTCPNGHS